MARRQHIPQRQPVFFGCEGESEVAYGQILNDLLQDAGLPINLQVEALTPGAGDPLSRVQRTLKFIARRERQRVKYQTKVILMDSDQGPEAPNRMREAKRIARAAGIEIIWQNPCHEALLLRHMPSCAARRPLDCNSARQSLEKIWSGYRKPMRRIQLSERVDLTAVRQAATVEPKLRLFLRTVGLLL